METPTLPQSGWLIKNLNSLKPADKVAGKRIDCNYEKLFTRLILIEREYGVRECLKHELTQYPLALYEPDGGED